MVKSVFLDVSVFKRSKVKGQRSFGAGAVADAVAVAGAVADARKPGSGSFHTKVFHREREVIDMCIVVYYAIATASAMRLQLQIMHKCISIWDFS